MIFALAALDFAGFLTGAQLGDFLTDWVPSEHGTQPGGLQRRVARGLTWTLIDTWGSQLIGFVIFAILANELSPEDFGLVALAAVLVSLGQLFVDQGMGDAVVQRATLTRRQIDTAFWVSIVTGVLLTIVAILIAGPVARLLKQPELEPIIQVLSVIFILVGLSSIQMGILRRELDFRGLAIRKLLAIAIGGVVGVGMALANYGAWALVGQQVAMAVVTVVVMWAVTPWRPGFSFAREDFRSLFSFGINIVGQDLMAFLTRNSDNFLIGVFLGTTPLGYYTVAYRILDTSQILLVAAARRLVFPSFSRLQHNVDRMRRAYARMSRASGALTLPGYIGLALVAEQAIPVLFGEKWLPSVPVAQLLFLIGPAHTINAFSGAVWSAVGHPEIGLRFRLISTVTSVIGFAIAVFFFADIIAVAAAYTLRSYLLLPLNLYWLRKYGNIPIRQQLSGYRGLFLATGVMAVAVIGVKLVLGDVLAPAGLLVVEVLVGAVVYLIALSIFERALVRELVGLGIQVVPGGERIARRMGIKVHLPPVTKPRDDDELPPDLPKDEDL
jgi:PST family polysaccharide transporter